jgi:hypothetical protein
VAYSYSDFPDSVKDEQAALNAILEAASAEGQKYLSDSDARPAGSASAFAHLWDNGATAAQGLKDVLAVRSKAIDQFGIHNIRQGEPLSVLEDVFVPLYFFHRYQAEATAKVIGGIDYSYQVKGSNQQDAYSISAKTQKEALRMLLRTLDAAEMAIPEEKLSLFPPRSPSYNSGRESFKGKTGVTFDPLSAPETSADMTLGFLLHPQRATRLIQQKALDKNQLDLEEVLSALWQATIGLKHKDDYINNVQLNINFRVFTHLLNLAQQEMVHPQVNAITHAFLKEKAGRLSASKDLYEQELFRRYSAFLTSPENFKVIPVPTVPDGSPIGMNCSF